MDKRNVFSSVFFILIAAFVLVTSTGLGIGQLNNPRPGLFPFTASICLIVFCVALLVDNFRHKNSLITLAGLWQDSNWRKNIIVIAALIIYTIFLAVIGYIPATFALMIVLFIIEGMKTWLAIANSALAVTVSYALFQYILKIPLPRSIWGL